ncbi:hypothetical protein L218DRAFT_565978 [Marasmius fiardii PR-910]|nr:hypothetical protein L218DRAFT_565978 [Marasmius fiardii PR-910]
MCQEACVWIGAISMIMQAACPSGGSSKLSKLQVLEYFANFSYKVPILRDALSFPSNIPETPEADNEKERYYRLYHPIMKLWQSQRPCSRLDRTNSRLTFPPQNSFHSQGMLCIPWLQRCMVS